MKAFIDQYRKFRHLCREEIGDLEDGEIMMLFSIYLEQRPQFNNPFSGLESFSLNTHLYSTQTTIRVTTPMMRTSMTTHFTIPL